MCVVVHARECACTSKCQQHTDLEQISVSYTPPWKNIDAMIGGIHPMNSLAAASSLGFQCAYLADFMIILVRVWIYGGPEGQSSPTKRQASHISPHLSNVSPHLPNVNPYLPNVRLHLSVLTYKTSGFTYQSSVLMYQYQSSRIMSVIFRVSAVHY